MKKWYASKTVWINLIAAVSVLLQVTLGVGLSLEVQASLIVVINFVLRLITKTSIGK